ncbi:hypothetical protein I8752_13950 [Nostocaceae cyanobacterium CENA369]|uniref:Uncharacterized protein n=1 Tax=Dendronalium phyllosphericum CENA369 TaxID=1725256 RepID=A0A8J7LDP1_9NOST|nr:hypothetical protein [Dendronalium phyllosphericum]MBH8574102.1 hypothetical protein [Dendronalium phyllosphericum CENA369]
MNGINKIYLRVLVQLLQRENLINSFIWFFQPALRAVYTVRQLSLEVNEDLASKHQAYKTKINCEFNCTAREQMLVSTGY